jgi:PAS domain S-box-containing protein
MANAWQDDERFRILVEGVFDYAIFMLDPVGRILTWNPGAERLKQYTASEIIGQHFSRFYPDADVQAGKCDLELEVAEREGRFEEEGWRIRKDGSRFWANVLITAVRDSKGALQGFAKVTRDLTERRNAEERLRQSEERVRLLIESIRDYAIFMLDPDGRIATWNAGAQELIGYRPVDVIGKHASIFNGEDAAESNEVLLVSAASGRAEAEGWRIRESGSRFWGEIVLTAMRDERNVLIGFACVIRDLTERKRAQEEHAARLAAEQSNRAKDQFLAILGHELRNPLAPIVTALDIMRGDPSFTNEREIIERQVKHLTRLVDDLLDVSRVATGKIELRKRRGDLRGVVRHAVELALPVLEARRHHLNLDLGPDALTVEGDDARLAQVFANLLNNAAKFTDPGGHISVVARLEGEEAAVEVVDDGVGIAPELLVRIFDMFVQADQGIERPTGGLGIGLSLVQSLVALHGGTVEARSEGAGKGSRFLVRLPLASPAAVGARTGHTGPIPMQANRVSRRVLIVDDNADALELMVLSLRRQGYDVSFASDGPSALRVALQARPEVAILDIGLPVMDGYALAERLRETMGEEAPRLIALTGYGEVNDRERSALAGFAAHLVKPLEMRQLIQTIDAVSRV